MVSKRPQKNAATSKTISMELDFSEFHPLDHSLFSRECASLPGGRKNHIELAWYYKWRGRVREQIHCRLGGHEWVEWKSKGGFSGVVCQNCPKNGDFTYENIHYLEGADFLTKD